MKWCLAFLLFAGCAAASDEAITIQWEGQKAAGFIIPQRSLSNFSTDSIDHLLQVRLLNSSASILGEYKVQDNNIEFRPLIAFTRGLQYTVSWRGRLLQQFDIPRDTTRKAPTIVSIYPSGDSLPVNLLKMYIVFSKPMREGQAVGHIAVIKNGQDTVPSVFLDMEPELWNTERTILTTWLDPGRIKRDLQPNKAMGTPLETGNRYEILVRQGWEDAEGAALAASHRTDFLAVARDDQSPNPAAWTIHPPKAGTVDPLRINAHESLDYMLLKNAVRITDGKGNEVSGSRTTAHEETVLHFSPAQAWLPGEYAIEVEPRLEDLAGNNLERLFDKDLLKDRTEKKMSVYKRAFIINR